MKGQKELGKDSFAKIPNGMPGVETRLYLLWDGGVRDGPHLDEPLRRDHEHRAREDLRPLPEEGHRSRSAPTRISSCGTARRSTCSATRRSTCASTTRPYEGREVVGAPTHVLSRGKVVVENGKYLGKKGDGRFVKRGTFNLG